MFFPNLKCETNIFLSKLLRSTWRLLKYILLYFLIFVEHYLFIYKEFKPTTASPSYSIWHTSSDQTFFFKGQFEVITINCVNIIYKNYVSVYLFER